MPKDAKGKAVDDGKPFIESGAFEIFVGGGHPSDRKICGGESFVVEVV